MNYPTEEQLKEFWTINGLAEQSTGSWYVDEVGGQFVSQETPKLIPDNIFLYVIPSIIKEKVLIRITIDSASGARCLIRQLAPPPLDTYFNTIDKDPILALFWVIWNYQHNLKGVIFNV